MRLRHLVLTLALVAGGGVPAGVSAADGTGDPQPLSIDTSDKPLETVLQWISRRSGVNVVCNLKETEQPRVTLRLASVSWQEAVEQIARKYELVIEKRNDRIWELTRPPRVRMEFQDARLIVILEALARQAGVNIVISDDIDSKKRLTMTLNDVPWREALDVIVKASGYAWIEQDYKIIRVISLDKVQLDLETEIFDINYASTGTGGGGGGAAPAAGGAAPAGGGGGASGGGGKIVEDIRSFLKTGETAQALSTGNKVLVRASRKTIQTLRTMLPRVDNRPKQVLIEMKFVDFSTGDARKVGFDPVSMNFDLANVGRLGFAFRPFAASPTATAELIRPITDSNGNQSIPTNSTRPSVNAVFEAISTLSSTKVLQSPQVLTLDNTLAFIDIGRKLHFAEETVTTENGIATRTLKESSASPVNDGIKISVTPTITNDGFVRIALDAKNSQATLKQISNKADPTSKDASVITLPDETLTNLTVQIMVKDGNTVMITGLLSNIVTEQINKVPLIGDLPVLGWLFKKKNDSIDQRNLTIFITPRIIPLGEESEYERRIKDLRSKLSGVAPVLAPVQSAQPE